MMESTLQCIDCDHYTGFGGVHCVYCKDKSGWTPKSKTHDCGINLADIKEDYILPPGSPQCGTCKHFTGTMTAFCADCENHDRYERKDDQPPKFNPPPMPQCKPAKECKDCVYEDGNVECVNCGEKKPHFTPKSDPVAHPNHYCKGGMECIDAIRAAVTGLTGFEAYCTGNILKYIWRWHDKNGAEDLRKAKQYIDFLIEEVEK